MKKYTSWVVLYSLLLQLTGCYSFSEPVQINEAVIGNFKNLELKITLRNGKTYFSDSYNITDNISNSDFIIGKGLSYSSNSSWYSSFEGHIYRNEIDSQIVEANTLNIWLKNQKRIEMNKGDYFIFTPDMKRGLWVFENSNIKFISVDDIKSIERKSFNGYTTTLCILLISLKILFIVEKLFQ
jgi:hypothetical protein